MSDTSLGAPNHSPRSDDSLSAETAHFNQRLQHIARVLLIGILAAGAAAVSVAILQPQAAVVAAVASTAACAAAVAALMLWAGAYATATAPRHRLTPSGTPRTSGALATSPQDRGWSEDGERLTRPRRHTETPDTEARPGRGGAMSDHHQGHGGDTEPHTDIAQRKEVWVTLARRLQTLIHRAIKMIDGLENKIEDPEILDLIYKIDNLITLARRKAENIAVLGGEPPQRRSTTPVELHSALIAAVSEVERFKQIAIVPTSDAFAIQGYVAAEIIHLLAELLENATQFTDPASPKVEVRAHRVTAGLAIEIQDRGLGVDPDALSAINGMLDGSAKLDIAEHLQAGRIGLAVVRELGRRNSVAVQLQTNIYGGVGAVVVLPRHLLVDPGTEIPSIPALPPVAPPTPRPALPRGTAPSPAQTTTPDTAQAQPAERPERVNEPLRQTQPATPRAPQTAPAAHLGPGLDAPSPHVDTPRSYPPGEFAPVPSPPPLPQRTGSSWMNPALRTPSPTATPTTPSAVPGHNTSLFADIQEGRNGWEPHQDALHRTNTATEPHDSPNTTHRTPDTRGERWPTT